MGKASDMEKPGAGNIAAGMDTQQDTNQAASMVPWCHLLLAWALWGLHGSKTACFFLSPMLRL